MCNKTARYEDAWGSGIVTVLTELSRLLATDMIVQYMNTKANGANVRLLV
jgi:hypothetical protein